MFFDINKLYLSNTSNVLIYMFHTELYSLSSSDVMTVHKLFIDNAL